MCGLTPRCLTKTHFVYDEAGHLIGEYNGSGALVQETVYLGDIPVGVWKAGMLYVIHADHLNTPRAILDAANRVIWLWKAEPFGSQGASSDPDGDSVKFFYNLRFPGQYFDQETGLFYNLNRYYSPGDGRYTTSDPIGLAGGVNPYTYVGGNPLSYIDPKGLSAAAGVGVGAVLFCARYPGVCAAGGVALCRLMGGCEIPDGMMNEDASGDEPQQCPSDDRNPSQDKKLKKSDIKKLQDNGIDPEELKGGVHTGQWDLFKDRKGNIYIKPKNGSGPGDPTGININDL